MPSRPAVLLAALLAATLACGEEPTTPGSPPAPAGPGAPEVHEVSRVDVVSPGPIQVSARGIHLATLFRVTLVRAGSPQTTITPVGGAVVTGDTLAVASFPIEIDTPNGDYFLRMDFRGADDLVTSRVSENVVFVARPVPSLDSIVAAPVAGHPDYLLVTGWGESLASLDSVVFDGALPYPPAGRNLQIGASTFEATFRVDPSWPAGPASLILGFHPTVSNAGTVLRLASAITLGPPAPPVIDPFVIQVWEGGASVSYQSISGTGLGRATEFRFESAAGAVGSTPRADVIDWLILGPYQEGPQLRIDTDGVASGLYDLIVTEGSQADTVSQAVEVWSPVPPNHLDIPPGTSSVSVDGSIVYGSPVCVYVWDWFGDFPESCQRYTVTVPGAGYLVFALDFVQDCNPSGGLWLSLATPGTAWGGEPFWAGCSSYSTAQIPTPVVEIGPHAFTVGLHGVPASWQAGDLAQYTLTVTYLPPGSVVQSPAGIATDDPHLKVIRR